MKRDIHTTGNVEHSIKSMYSYGRLFYLRNCTHEDPYQRQYSSFNLGGREKSGLKLKPNKTTLCVSPLGEGNLNTSFGSAQSIHLENGGQYQISPAQDKKDFNLYAKKNECEVPCLSNRATQNSEIRPITFPVHISLWRAWKCTEIQTKIQALPCQMFTATYNIPSF